MPPFINAIDKGERFKKEIHCCRISDSINDWGDTGFCEQ